MVSQSSALYWQTRGDAATIRFPAAALQVTGLKIFSYPMSTPLPDPNLTRDVFGDPPPDRGNALGPWPVQ